MWKVFPPQKGFTLVEALIASAIMGGMALFMVKMHKNQLGTNNHVEFQLKKIQLQTVLLGQILNDPNNCACFFEGAAPFPATPTSPGATLTGTAPTQLGRYQFATPGVCGTATMPRPMINTAGMNGIKLTDVKLTNIMQVGSMYMGDFQVQIQSMKEVLGPSEVAFKIPVVVNTSPAGANVNFVSCSMAASQNIPPPTVFPFTTPSGQAARTFLIPGIWSFCGLSGFKTNADDDDMYDGCYVESQPVGPAGSWQVRSSKHPSDPLTCIATCINL